MLRRISCALALFCAFVLAARGVDPDTFSPVVSYQYFDPPADLPTLAVQSQDVSYRFDDAQTRLILEGPTTVGAGRSVDYRAIFRDSAGQQTNVTIPAKFSFASGTPTYAGIGGSTLFVSQNAPASTIYLQASYENADGLVTSPVLPVAISPAFFAQFSATSQPAGGSDHQITLVGSVTGGIGDYTFRWDKNNDKVYGDLIGQSVNFSITSDGGTYPIGLEVIDSTQRRSYAKGYVTLNKQLVANQPQYFTARNDVKSGKLYGLDGQPFKFDGSRINNGFIVITHGLYGAGSDPWVGDMAARIAERLTANPFGAPNVAIYDWSEDSDPTGDDRLLHTVARQIVANAILDPAGLVTLPSPIEQRAYDFIADCYLVRDNAQTHGQHLATWMVEAALEGLINTREPVHLVGHSAGGFCVGEAALWLKKHTLNGKKVIVDRVTMLDTPFPYRAHLTTLAAAPMQPVVERYVSSIYGALLFPNSMQRFAPLGEHYRLSHLGEGYWKRLGQGETGHGLSHRWYRRTIKPANEEDGATLDSYGDEGFLLSPFLDGPKVERPNNSSSRPLLQDRQPSALGHTSTAQPVTEFSSFGNVTSNEGVYTITEQADAGIVKHLALPSGAQALKFRFTFSSPGDGDYIEVRFADHFHLFKGIDDALSRNGFTEIEMPLDGLEGIDGNLVVTLVSRGAPNAVVQVTGFNVLTIDDLKGRLANLSTRLSVETGDNALIGGFIVTGTQPKKIIIRGIGPSLPLADKLVNPTLELRNSSGTLLASNDDWQQSPDKQAIIDSTIPPTNDLEAAIVATLPANNAGYTAIVRGKNGGTGIGVVEAYDLDTSVDSKLANISTRGFVQTGDNVLIAGTIVVGQASQKVIVRAIGPSLTGLGVSGALQDPNLELRDGNGALVRSNDNWRSDQEAEIIATTIPPTNDFESAIVATLPSNGAAYTAIVRGMNNTTGIAVVEVYGLD